MIVSCTFDSFNPIIFVFILSCNRNTGFLNLGQVILCVDTVVVVEGVTSLCVVGC